MSQFTMNFADATAVLANYRNSTGENAAYKGIPIEYLESIRTALKIIYPGNYRIRFRGPRNNPRDYRPANRRYQDCVRQFAKTFSVYVD